MFRYLKHVLCVVPSLVSGRPLQTEHELGPDLGSISLYVPEISGAVTPEDRQLRFNVLESANVCGYGNITINRQLLPQALDGSGQGAILTETGREIEASWRFRCLNVRDRPHDQLLDFRIEAVDGIPVSDVSFLIRFHQTLPVRISGGDFYLTPNRPRRHPSTANNTTTSDDGNDGNDEDEEPATASPDLDQELADLDNLAAQLALLEKQIAEKETHLTRVFGWSRPKGEDSEAQKCETLKCKLTALLRKYKIIQQEEEEALAASTKEDVTLVTQGISTKEDVEPPPPYTEGEIPLAQESPTPTAGDDTISPVHPVEKLVYKLYDYGFSLWWTIPMAVPVIYFLTRFLRRMRSPSARSYKEQKQRRRCEERAARRSSTSARADLFWSLVTFSWLARGKRRPLPDEEKEAIASESDMSSSDAGDDRGVDGLVLPPPPPPPSSAANSRSRSDSIASSTSSLGRPSRGDGAQSDSESEDDMQREIAALRVAADLVGDMITGEPGSVTRRYSNLLPGWRRAMQWQQRQRLPRHIRGEQGQVGRAGCGRPRATTPPSPTFLGYESDETLPAYSPPENGRCSSEDDSEDERAARVERTSRYRMER